MYALAAAAANTPVPIAAIPAITIPKTLRNFLASAVLTCLTEDSTLLACSNDFLRPSRTVLACLIVSSQIFTASAPVRTVIFVLGTESL